MSELVEIDRRIVENLYQNREYILKLYQESSRNFWHVRVETRYGRDDYSFTPAEYPNPEKSARDKFNDLYGKLYVEAHRNDPKYPTWRDL